MQVITVEASEQGQRLDKFLKRYFKEASSGFIYKMLRKKNITLNKQKADGTEILNAGDCVYTFFSDETFSKLKGNAEIDDIFIKAFNELKGISVIFENNDLIFLNKPIDVLSQTDEHTNISVNEWLIGYLYNKGYELDLNRYKPSCVNRLDRNTSGILMAAKTYAGSRFLTDCIKNHRLNKYYTAVCQGIIKDKGVLKGKLVKDDKKNKSSINNKSDGVFVHTEYEPLYYSDDYTVVWVKLVTGKSHQIRAHMSSIGHPLAGDYKYGGKSYGNIKHQLLHSTKLVFPVLENDIFGMSGKTIEAALPDYFPKS